MRYTRLRKKYISLYAALLKSDVNRLVVDDNKEIEELDRGLDIELILQWRYCILFKYAIQLAFIMNFGFGVGLILCYNLQQ